MLDRSLAPDLGVIDENEVVSDGLSAKDNELSDNQNIDRSVRTVLCGANHILISGIIPKQMASYRLEPRRVWFSKKV